MKRFKLIVFGIVVALLVTFAWQNQAYFQQKNVLSLNLIVAGPYKTPEISNAVICIVTFLIGIIVLYLFSLSGRIKQRKSMKALNITLSDRQSEINSLKSELDASKKSPSLDSAPPDKAAEAPTEYKETVDSAS